MQRFLKAKYFLTSKEPGTVWVSFRYTFSIKRKAKNIISSKETSNILFSPPASILSLIFSSKKICTNTSLSYFSKIKSITSFFSFIFFISFSFSFSFIPFSSAFLKDNFFSFAFLRINSTANLPKKYFQKISSPKEDKFFLFSAYSLHFSSASSYFLKISFFSKAISFSLFSFSTLNCIILKESKPQQNGQQKFIFLFKKNTNDIKQYFLLMLIYDIFISS